MGSTISRKGGVWRVMWGSKAALWLTLTLTFEVSGPFCLSPRMDCSTLSAACTLCTCLILAFLVGLADMSNVDLLHPPEEILWTCSRMECKTWDVKLMVMHLAYSHCHGGVITACLWTYKSPASHVVCDKPSNMKNFPLASETVLWRLRYFPILSCGVDLWAFLHSRVGLYILKTFACVFHLLPLWSRWDSAVLMQRHRATSR